MLVPEMKNIILNKLKEGDVKAHITKIGYDDDVRYTTSMGIYVDGVLDETFHLTDVTNPEIDKFMKELNDLIMKNTLYLI